ncbi:MAG: GIY-YIG nuclease family protein [Salegentibacter sp.]
MHFHYIIFSKIRNKYYVGETHNPEERLIRHNDHAYQNAFTNMASDWQIVLLKKVNHREDAVFLEAFIKRRKSRKFVEKIIAHPEILDRIQEKK